MLTVIFATVGVAFLIVFFLKYRNVLWIVATVYVIAVLYITLFSRISTEEGQAINLMPFHFFYWVKIYVTRKNLRGLIRPFLGVYMNTLMFVPFGFLTKSLKSSVAAWKIIFAGFIFSLYIELTQMIFHLGMFETDDLMTNTLGAWIGIIIYQKWGERS